MKGSVDELLALSTLASGTVVNAPFDSTVNERTLISSTDIIWSMGDHTEGEGPIVVGLNHSDYTAAEVQEWYDATLTWNEGSLVERELAQRKIKVVGVFAGNAVETLNNGLPIHTKLNWILNQGQTIDVWALNRDDDPLTTGSDIELQGKANLWAQ